MTCLKLLALKESSRIIGALASAADFCLAAALLGLATCQRDMDAELGGFESSIRDLPHNLHVEEMGVHSKRKKTARGNFFLNTCNWEFQ